MPCWKPLYKEGYGGFSLLYFILLATNPILTIDYGIL